MAAPAPGAGGDYALFCTLPGVGSVRSRTGRARAPPPQGTAARVTPLLLGRSGRSRALRGRRSLFRGRRGGLGEHDGRALDAVKLREALVEVRLAFLRDTVLRGSATSHARVVAVVG